MNEYIKLGYLLVFGFWLFISVKWIQAGKPFMKGQKKYQPWLKADSYLNKYIGSHFFFGGVFFSIACVLAITGTLIEVFLHKETFLYPLGFLSLIGAVIAGVSFLYFRRQAFKLEPKYPQKKVEL